MKLCKLFLMGAIALGMVACNNNENVPEVTGEKDASICIKVFPSSNGPLVRATGDLSGNGVSTTGLAAESAIKTLEAWVFNNGNLEKYKSVSNAMEITDIEVTSGSRTIVVVANASLGSQATLTALQDITKDLTQDITNGLVMTTEPISVTLVKGNNYYGYTDAEVANKTAPTGNAKTNLTPEVNSIKNAIALTRINARVAIVSAALSLPTLNPGEVQLFDALTDAQVAIFNVPKTSGLFGTSLAKNASHLFGAAWPSTDGSYMAVVNGGAVESTLTDDVAFPIVNTAAPYYYVNENTATDEKAQMLMVLRAKPALNGVAVVFAGLYTDADGYTYYPVWVNAAKTGYTYDAGYAADSKILRNTQYNISLTIKGIGNPTIDEAETAYLDVKVQVAPWAVVNQNVTW